jgi:hypothetical protein
MDGLDGLDGGLGLAGNGENKHETSYVKYELHFQDGHSPDLTEETLEERRLEIWEYACSLVPGIHDYLWNMEKFELAVVLPPLRTDAEVPKKGILKKRVEYAEPHLAGITRFGDNVDDEWLIVHTLFQISKRFSNVVARVVDDDGDFLLIECAAHIPAWLAPSNSANRTWIRGGAFILLEETDAPLEGGKKKVKRHHDEVGGVPLADALMTLFDRKKTDDTDVSPTSAIALQSTQCHAALRTIETHRFGALHHWKHTAHCCVPQAVALAIQQHPQIVAAAVTAFYNRDPTEVSKSQTLSAFQKEKDKDQAEKAGSLSDLVVVRTHFTRCLYAQLSQQRFSPPGIYLKALSSNVQHDVVAALSQLEENDAKGPGSGNAGGGGSTHPHRNEFVTPQVKSVLLGARLACGMQILLERVKRHTSDFAALVATHAYRRPEDLFPVSEGEGEIDAAVVVLRSLNLAAAMSAADGATATVGTAAAPVGKPAPTSVICSMDDNNWKDDDEDWLDVTQQDLDAHMQAFSQQGEDGGGGAAVGLDDMDDDDNGSDSSDDSDDDENHDHETGGLGSDREGARASRKEQKAQDLDEIVNATKGFLSGVSGITGVDNSKQKTAPGVDNSRKQQPGTKKKAAAAVR